MGLTHYSTDRLDDAWHLLLENFSHSREKWSSPERSKLENDHWQPFEKETDKYLDAVREILDAIEQAERFLSETVK